MNFYRDFCQQRLTDIEEHLVEAGAALDGVDDEEIDTREAMVRLSYIIGSATLAQSMLTTMAAAKVYKIGGTYLQMDAVQAEDLQAEAGVVAEIGRVAVEDAYAAHDPAPLGIGHGYTHPAYPRILSRIPIRHIYRMGPQGLFNGCLFQHGDQAIFSCRTQGFPSRTSLYLPKVDLMFTDPKEVTLPESFQFCSVEDMRIFRHKDMTLACFTLAGQTEKGWYAQMVLAEIDRERNFTWVHAIASPKSHRVEKNWSFFSCDDRLFCIYFTVPHLVYEVDLSSGAPVLISSWEADNWQSAGFMENARGGSPPVRIGDEFYHFYHTQHRHGHGVAYQTGLYTFDAKPPWNIRRIIKGPLLGLMPSKRPLDVIFVTGAQPNGKRWNLSCGLMDQETVVISLGFDDVENLLKKV